MTDQPTPTARLALSVGEAANLLNVSDRTVRELVARREIPFVRIRRRVLFIRAELEAWLREQRAAGV